MKTLIILTILYSLFQLNIKLYAGDKSNDSLTIKEKKMSCVYVDFGGTSPWLSVNYQQTIFSKKKYSLDLATGLSNRFVETNIFQNHWYLLNSFSYKNILFEIGLGLKFSNFYDDNDNIISGIKTESDLMFQLAFRYNISKRFFIRCSAYEKIYDLSPNYTSYFYDYYNRHTHGIIQQFPYFPVSISVGFTSELSKKNTYQSLYKNSKNALFFNILNYSFGYERRLLKKNEHYLFASYQNIIIPYKRYYESNKRGLFYALNFSLNYSFSYTPSFAPIVGISYVHIYNKFSVLNQFLYEKADYLRSNIGIKIALYKNIFATMNYNPIIKLFNDNTTLNKENTEVYLNVLNTSITNFNICLGYSF